MPRKDYAYILSLRHDSLDDLDTTPEHEYTVGIPYSEIVRRFPFQGSYSK